MNPTLTMKITRRSAGMSDNDFCRKVHHRAYRDVCVQQFGPWNEREQDNFFESSWSAGGFEVIHDNQHRLLLQRKHDGSWSLPAGAIELGESPEQAVIRKILEETGFQCVSSEIVGVFGGASFRHTYPNSDQVEYVVILFKCVAMPYQEILDTTETATIQFFGRTEMPGLALPYDINLLYT